MSKIETLKDCCSFQEGYVNPSQKIRQYFGGNIKWLRASDLTGFFVHDTEKTLSQKGYESAGTSAFMFKKDTLAISKSGTIGTLGILKDEMCGNRAVINIDVDKTKADLFYIFYLLKYKNKELISKAHGSIQKNLYISVLEQTKLNHRDLSTQQKIAAVLSALDAKIELNQRINAELESMAKTLYDYWFVQFDFPNEKGKPYKSAGGKMVWNEELKREIPLGWEVCELRQYLTTNRGLSYSGKDITGGGAPMINLNSFNVNATYKPEGIKTYSGDYGKNKVLKPFDLVMCNTQQTALDPKKDIIGKSLLVPDIFESDIVSSHHVTTITTEKENLKYYLNSLFNTEYFHRYISGYSTGTNILGLNFEGVLSFKTAIPSDELLEKYKSIALNIEKQKARIIKESQTLTELRDWVMPMLMNGQVKVE
jgi:type I restriction enzyme S subunit